MHALQVKRNPTKKHTANVFASFCLIACILPNATKPRLVTSLVKHGREWEQDHSKKKNDISAFPVKVNDSAVNTGHIDPFHVTSSTSNFYTVHSRKLLLSYFLEFHKLSLHPKVWADMKILSGATDN